MLSKGTLVLEPMFCSSWPPQYLSQTKDAGVADFGSDSQMDCAALAAGRKKKCILFTEHTPMVKSETRLSDEQTSWCLRQIHLNIFQMVICIHFMQNDSQSRANESH